MAKTRTLQSVLNAGELTPKLKGRAETPRYKNALERCRNMVPLVHGGATRRWGTRYVAPAAAADVRLEPMIIEINGVATGYLLEFTNAKLRFYANGARIMSGGSPCEITSPYSTAQLWGWNYDQNDNDLYTAHTAVPVKKLSRTSDTSWTYADVAFTNQPRANEWSVSNGYPGAITFYDQRMILAGSTAKPRAIWGSKSGDPLTFLIGTLDNDPYEFIPSQVKTRIRHLSATDQIVIFSQRREVTLSGGNAAITPTNFQFKGRTSRGCSGARPLVLDGQIFFPTATGKRFCSFNYKYEKDRYLASDFGFVADHLLEDGDGIIQVAYAAEPYSCFWAVTKKGNLLSFTYDEEQDVWAWAKHHTAPILPEDAQTGQETTYYKSVAVIPDANGQDQVWLAVQRLVGGSYQTYIEYMDSALLSDCAVTGTDAAGKTVWTGLSHLEGQTVVIKADGIVVPSQVVTGGQITLASAAKAVEVGLPYKSVIKELPFDPAQQGGTIQGAAVAVSEISVLLHESQGCTVNGEQIPFRRFGQGVLDQPITSFSGWKKVGNLGWGGTDASQVTIEQDLPLPLTVLAIAKEVTVNG